MLSRISTALAQFVKPVNPGPGSSRPESPRHRSSGGFQKFSQEKEKEPGAKVIPFPEKEKPSIEQQPAPSAGTASVTTSFLQIFSLLQGQRTKMLHWLGARNYHLAATKGQKGVRYLKGAMMDHKAE